MNNGGKGGQLLQGVAPLRHGLAVLWSADPLLKVAEHPQDDGIHRLVGVELVGIREEEALQGDELQGIAADLPDKADVKAVLLQGGEELLPGAEAGILQNVPHLEGVVALGEGDGDGLQPLLHLL